MSRFKTLGTESENVYISPFTVGHVILYDEHSVRATPTDPTPVPNVPGDNYPPFPTPGVNYRLPRSEPVSSQPPTKVIDRSSYGPSERYYASLRYYGTGPY